MKRLLLFLAITMASVCAMQAGQINESDARQIADKFFGAKSSRLTASAGQSAARLAYKAENDRFFIFDRSEHNGFVVVAGDDRLPQVLGYSETGRFTSGDIPPAMQDWMAEMNREIAFLQSHSNVAAYQPVKREVAVGPLMTTQWDQDWPYNLLCPVYTISNGSTVRSVTGCVATAMVQIMNYHKWPIQGTGSHTYNYNVNGTDPTTLSADFSQSVYEWDKMLDTYDANSSEESCYAVAKLMSDAGISIDMGYGSSSGASETAVMMALVRYFGYSDKCYLLDRDLYGAAEWDQLLIDEITARRPILYCGYTYTQGSIGGHAFVFDGFDTNGYFHVNWGWGGSADGYFLVSLLAPGSGFNFKYGQDAIFGVVRAADADQVPDVMYVRAIMHPDMYSVPRGEQVSMKFSDMYVQGNLLDTAGIDNTGYRPMAYDLVPMEVRVFDQNGVQRQSHPFSYKVYLSNWWFQGPNIDFTPDASLEDGEYVINLAYSSQKNDNYDSWVRDDSGQKVYCKMLISDGMVYLSDCYLAMKYSLESLSVEQSIYVDEPFSVNVKLSNASGGYGPPGGQAEEPVTKGRIHLLMKKNGEVVAVGEPVEISIPRDSTATYSLQATAPSEWGLYEIMVVDDSGGMFVTPSGWFDTNEDESILNVIVVPVSEELVEDFETMTANTKTNQTYVQGRFTTWSFYKSGVRAPGEGKCYGTNAIMMKKPSMFYSEEPLKHQFFMAAATFFNSASKDAMYTLEYSVDNGETWTKALTIEGVDAATVRSASITQAIWQLDIPASAPSLFRVTMIDGGTAATYIDNFILRYSDSVIVGDVNLDGEVNIADINAIIDIILSDETDANADVNNDGEVNIADINAIIDIILGVS